MVITLQMCASRERQGDGRTARLAWWTPADYTSMDTKCLKALCGVRGGSVKAPSARLRLQANDAADFDGGTSGKAALFAPSSCALPRGEKCRAAGVRYCARQQTEQDDRHTALSVWADQSTYVHPYDGFGGSGANAIGSFLRVVVLVATALGLRCSPAVSERDEPQDEDEHRGESGRQRTVEVHVL